MSRELTEQPRIVKCPKCRLLLPEYSHYTVYMCGGCGTTLQAKKRKKQPATPESCTRETDAAPRNVVNRVCSNGEQPILIEEKAPRTSLDGANGCSQTENGECIDRQLIHPQENVVRTKSTSSSSGECSLDGDGGSSQNENWECNENQLVLPQEDVVMTKRTSSSSGECSLDGDGGSSQNEKGDCNENRLVLPREDAVKTKRTSSSSGDSSLNVNGERDQNENGECDEMQLALPQQNVLKTESTSSSSGKYPLDVNENGECNEKLLVLNQEKMSRTNSTSSSSGECSLDVNGGSVQIRNEESNGKNLDLPLGTNATSFSSREYSSDENGRREQDNNGGCSGEESNGKNLDLPLGTKATSFSSREYSSDENGRREQDNNGGCSGEQLDLPHENIQGTKSTSFSSGEYSLIELGRGDQNENGEFNVAFCLSDEDLENEMNTENLSRNRFKQHKISNKGCSTELTETELVASSLLMGGESSVEETANADLQLAGEEGTDNGNLLFKEAKGQLIGASDGVDANDDKSAQIEAKSEVENAGSGHTAKGLTNDNLASGKGSASGNSVSSPNKQMKQALEPKPHTFDNSEVMNQSSELSGDLGELSKSPTTRSYHAYDGSVSSYDEMVDKQLPDQHLNPFQNNYNSANIVSEGRHRKGKSPINRMNIPPDLPRGKHHVMKDTKRSQYEALETTRHDRPFRHRMRAGTGDYPPRMPYHRSGSQAGYESDIPLNQMPDDEQYFSSSSFLSHDYCEDSDQEKMKLLKMIYKLQNQLKRTSSLKEDTAGRLFPSVSYKGNHVSASHSHDFHEGRRFNHDLGDPWCDARFGLINWRQRSKISQRPFSAEATSSMHRVDNSCFHCRHQEWRYSTELPPHILYQYEDLCSYHPGHNNCCYPHRSYPFSAPRYMSSKLQLYSHETESNDQRHRAHEMRMYFREKQHMNKKHFRPVAGGAPFITCRNCFKLLQLPADFLLFKRVCHHLKCGHCSEILKFSLQDRSHIVSYDPSQLDDHEVINGSINMASSASHANYFHSSHAVPISYSDDYGNYVSKSYSSGGDPVSLTPLHPLHGSEHDTNDSCGAFKEEDKIAPRHACTSKAPAGTQDSPGISSTVSMSEKSSSEMEVPLPPPRSSPLHQLMGYSSPSQVIRGIQSSGKGNEHMQNEQHDYS